MWDWWEREIPGSVNSIVYAVLMNHWCWKLFKVISNFAKYKWSKNMFPAISIACGFASEVWNNWVRESISGLWTRTLIYFFYRDRKSTVVELPQLKACKYNLFRRCFLFKTRIWIYFVIFFGCLSKKYILLYFSFGLLHKVNIVGLRKSRH